MRHLKTVLVLAASVVLTIALAQPARADVSFDMAYSNLSDHGSWVVSAQYGHVWQPREYNRQWSPYEDGHWVYTDMGWTWVSDYAWGAIPYHYGTWVDDPRVGWVWIPGRTWAPAWVVFRTTPEYIGWAPVPPGFSVGMTIDMGAPSSFIFVSSHDFLAPRLRGSIIPRERTNVFINNTTVVNNIVIQNNVVINRGPDYRTIERATGSTIRETRIESVARVAPYQNVSRAQLAVAPERVKQGLRVAEPVPASEPLPVSKKQGRPSGQGKESVVAPTRASSPNLKPAPVAPSNQAEVTDKPNAQRNPKDDQHAKAQSDAAAVKQHHAKAESDAAVQQQHAKAQSDAAVQQPHAKAQPNAKTQTDAKAKADAKAKKDHPDTKDGGSDKGTNGEPQKPSEK